MREEEISQRAGADRGVMRALRTPCFLSSWILAQDASILCPPQRNLRHLRVDGCAPQAASGGAVQVKGKQNHMGVAEAGAHMRATSGRWDMTSSWMLGSAHHRAP